MGRESSYGKTQTNNVTEDEALNVLLLADKRFQLLDTKKRTRILELLGLHPEFKSRVFDLIQTTEPLPPLQIEDLEGLVDSLKLIEVKATKAPIQDELLEGFFFGATENEYRIAESLGDRYQFAFVVLRPGSERPAFYVLLPLAEVTKRTRTKRTQFQVNFHGTGKKRRAVDP